MWEYADQQTPTIKFPCEFQFKVLLKASQSHYENKFGLLMILQWLSFLKGLYDVPVTTDRVSRSRYQSATTFLLKWLWGEVLRCY